MSGTVGNDATSPYVYESLKGPATEIRLIMFHQGTNAHYGGPPMLGLSTWLLEDAPPYLALSYTWGPLEPSFAIRVDGGTMSVAQNCFDALCRLSSAEPEPIGNETFTNSLTLCWIDSICVHQTDLAEKSRQVQMMAIIYASAACVTVWLGMRVGEEYDFLATQGRAMKSGCVRERRDSTAPPPSTHFSSPLPMNDVRGRGQKNEHRKAQALKHDSSRSAMRETMRLPDGTQTFTMGPGSYVWWYRWFGEAVDTSTREQIELAILKLMTDLYWERVWIKQDTSRRGSARQESTKPV
ncbi:hypothetical protein LTR95_010435 [Oleoguttula sp. CCFEE 5521]